MLLTFVIVSRVDDKDIGTYKTSEALSPPVIATMFAPLLVIPFNLRFGSK